MDIEFVLFIFGVCCGLGFGFIAGNVYARWQ